MNKKYISVLEGLNKGIAGVWAERIISQLEYAVKLSEVNEGKYDSIIEDAINYVATKKDEDGAITRDTSAHAEDVLKVMAGPAKSLKMICAAHAHIDMNWMWGFEETVSVALNTFRTMLNLMNEYPGFKFSQSQASVYRIVEEYDPEMLKEIKNRIKEGRWEVTASTWVETDKNMPNGESLARHILYTKKYLSELLELNPDSLQLDFEPDTFGHSRNVPEILAKGGVKYYYHCRGYSGHNIYKWQAPSGSSAIVYREPLWYNAAIDANIAAHVPEFCSHHGIDTVLKVYGVGDHGGGPTRRDIEKLIEMNTWPIFPTIRFGTFNEFFHILSGISHKLPVVDQELNFIFTGCYTTQSRIKLANRVSEAKLNEAETFGSLAATFAGGSYNGKAYEGAWEKVLFNQFHDIIPGSGVIETREYAMGQFQQVLAAANTGIAKSLGIIASQINTSTSPDVDEDYRFTNSEGAGVGHTVVDFGLPQAERGRGKNRIVNFFNPSAHDRNEPVEITLWDWPGDISKLDVKDMEGNKAGYQLLSKDKKAIHCSSDYWGHEFITLLIDAAVPSFGYSTYTICESMEPKNAVRRDEPRNEYPDTFVLENDLLKVEFDKKNARITGMLDKRKGVLLVDNTCPSGIFRLIEEDDGKGMTAWVVGRYMNITGLDQNVKIIDSFTASDALRQWITYRIKFRESVLKVTVSLDSHSSRLNYSVECDWQERAVIGRCVPQLNFHMPFKYISGKYRYDVPYGTIIRESLDMDVPANSWAVAIPDGNEESAVMLVSNSKYGFRGVDSSISMTLIRSSYDPDPYPENYIHRFKFAVDIVDSSATNSELITKGYDYNHPVSFLPNLTQNGGLPPVKGFMALEGGNVNISAVKAPENAHGSNDKLIIRLYEAEGKSTPAALKFDRNVNDAWYTDLNESRIESGRKVEINGDKVGIVVDAYSVVTICVQFR